MTGKKEFSEKVRLLLAMNVAEQDAFKQKIIYLQKCNAEK